MINRIKEYNGFLSHRGGYLDRTEWHAFVIGIGSGLAGGLPLLFVMYGLVFSGKKLTGHLKDVKKEFAYTVGSFTVVEGIEWWLLLLT